MIPELVNYYFGTSNFSNIVLFVTWLLLYIEMK